MTRMPAIKPSSRLSSSEDVNAAIERVTPDVLALLADGVPRDESAIIAAFDGRRHPKHDVRLTVMRLDVLGQLDLQGGRYSLPVPEAERG